MLRLYASGMVTEENWRDLWAEWQDKRQRLRGGLALLDQRCETYISDLDEALNIIAKLGILYEMLPHPDQKELLRNVVERVVLNPEGNIIRVDWLPPFAYLQVVSEKVSCGRSSSENLAENQTSGDAGCSSGVLDCGNKKTRTSTIPKVVLDGQSFHSLTAMEMLPSGWGDWIRTPYIKRELGTTHPLDKLSLPLPNLETSRILCPDTSSEDYEFWRTDEWSSSDLSQCPKQD